MQSESVQNLPFPDKIKDPEEYINPWNEVRQDVLAILNSVPDDSFLKRPLEGGWSASEIGEHLYLTQFGFARIAPAILGGKFGIDIGERDVDYKETFNKSKEPQGIQNPEQVTPSGKMDKKEVIKSLNKAMERMLKNLKGRSADELRTRGMDHALGGLINLLEWLWVLTLHENAHLQVLKKKFG